MVMLALGNIKNHNPILIYCTEFYFFFTFFIYHLCGIFLYVQAYNAKAQQRYSTTKTLGYTAAVLSVVNITYTGIATFLIVGLSIGIRCGEFDTFIVNIL